MENKIVCMKVAIALVGGMAVNLLGGYDELLKVFIMSVIIDFIMGILSSIKKKQFSSTVARWGFVGKLLYFMIIALCVQLDNVMGKDDLIRNVAIVWFLICECASILENAANLGMPLPKGLIDVLVQAKNSFSIRIIDVVKKMVMEYSTEGNAEIKKESEENENE